MKKSIRGSIIVVTALVFFACQDNKLIEKLLAPPFHPQASSDIDRLNIDVFAGNFKQTTVIDVNLNENDFVVVELCQKYGIFHEIKQLYDIPKKVLHKPYCVVLFATKQICFYNV